MIGITIVTFVVRITAGLKKRDIKLNRPKIRENPRHLSD